jgi:hypothetical protein
MILRTNGLDPGSSRLFPGADLWRKDVHAMYW